MDNWVFILFVVDVAFMVGILFMLLSYRKSNKVAGTELAMAGGAPALTGEHHIEMMDKLKEELSAAESITKRLDKKRHDLEELEASLQTNKKAMDRVINRASAETRVPPRNWNDDYEHAVSMLDAGASVDEVVEKFGLLSGEAELITSLNNLKN
ncbi:MAG: DUF2802 domain-containing protein [Proteobacteria bacterium]|nr:DUF2802 domain-containing protein [Pseudomonadota bacterium]